MIKTWYRRIIGPIGLQAMLATVLLCLLFPPQLLADSKRVLLVPSQDKPVYQSVISHLRAAITDPELLLVTAPPAGQIGTTNLDGFDLVVAIGTTATRAVFKRRPDTPVLSVFIPRRTFESLLAAQPQQRPVSALYLEQPFARQLKLLKLISPESTQIGSIVGSSSAAERPLLENAAADAGLQLNLSQLRPDDNPIEILTPVISSSDAFLAVPDRSIFNRSTAKWILLMSFRQRIPLIAYSKRYVDAGAVAAVYSTPETTGRETAQRILQWLASPDALAPPSYPEFFDVSTNRGAARSLRLQLPVKEELLRGLQTP